MNSSSSSSSTSPLKPITTILDGTLTPALETTLTLLFLLASPLYHPETYLFHLLHLPTTPDITFRMFPSYNPNPSLWPNISEGEGGFIYPPNCSHSFSLILLLLTPWFLSRDRRHGLGTGQVGQLFRYLGWTKTGGATTKRTLMVEYALIIFRVWLGSAWLNVFLPRAAAGVSPWDSFIMFLGFYAIL